MPCVARTQGGVITAAQCAASAPPRPMSVGCSGSASGAASAAGSTRMSADLSPIHTWVVAPPFSPDCGSLRRRIAPQRRPHPGAAAPARGGRSGEPHPAATRSHQRSPVQPSCRPTRRSRSPIAAVAKGLTSLDALADAQLRGRPGAQLARLVVARTDPLSDNWFESSSRWWLMEAGLPRPELQVPFTGPDGTVRVDLLMRDTGRSARRTARGLLDDLSRSTAAIGAFGVRIGAVLRDRACAPGPRSTARPPSRRGSPPAAPPRRSGRPRSWPR